MYKKPYLFMEKKMRLQRTLVLFGAIFVLFQMITGGSLFYLKYGFSISEIVHFFQGNEAEFIMPKSVEGMLKTTLPHIVAITMVGIFLIHILDCEKKYRAIIASLFFTGMIFDLLGGYLILIHSVFAWIKFVGFLFLEVGVLAAILLIFYSISNPSYKERSYR